MFASGLVTERCIGSGDQPWRVTIIIRRSRNRSAPSASLRSMSRYCYELITRLFRCLPNLRFGLPISG